MMNEMTPIFHLIFDHP